MAGYLYEVSSTEKAIDNVFVPAGTSNVTVPSVTVGENTIVTRLLFNALPLMTGVTPNETSEVGGEETEKERVTFELGLVEVALVIRIVPDSV